MNETAQADVATDVRRIILTDDHGIVRHAIRTVLENNQEFAIVAEAGSGDECLELVTQHKPDILVLDLGLPGKSGIEVIFELKQQHSPVKIVVLTMYEDELKMKQALAAGADAYVLKSSSPEVFLEALQTVEKGGTFLIEKFRHILEEVDTNTITDPKAIDHDPLGQLSKREREVFFLLADGMPNRVIAKRLFISPRTVETHRARVIKKLGFNSTADLIRYAIRNNLLSL